MQVHEWFGGSILLTATTTPVLHLNMALVKQSSQCEQTLERGAAAFSFSSQRLWFVGLSFRKFLTPSVTDGTPYFDVFTIPSTAKI